MSKRLWSAATAAVARALALSRTAPVGAAGDYTTVTAIHQEFQAIRRPTVAGLPDYSPAGLAAQRDALRQLRRRLDAVDPRAWPVSQQQGDGISLWRFHDDLLALGWIPVSLARREMTGLDDEVKRLW